MTESWLRFALTPDAKARAIARGEIEIIPAPVRPHRFGPRPGFGRGGRPLDPKVSEAARLVVEEGLGKSEACARTGVSLSALKARLKSMEGSA